MAFTPKDWRDYPDTSTPITAAALEDLESRVTTYADNRYPVVNVKDYGTNSAAIQAAIDSLPAYGGTIYFPRGTYLCSSSINLRNRRSIRLIGEGSPNFGYGTGTVLIYTASGTTPFLDCTSVNNGGNAGTHGLHFEHLDIRYNNTGFTGSLVDLRNVAAANNYDTHDIFFTNCHLGSNPPNVASAQSLVRMNNSYAIRFRGCSFMGAQDHIWGREGSADIVGGISANYCNDVEFSGCVFQGAPTIGATNSHVRNSGGAWAFRNCVFQGLQNGKAGAYTHDPGFLAAGLTFEACWFGDVSAAGNPQIKFTGTGLNVRGCRIGLEGAAESIIRLSENNCVGVVIEGNLFNGATGGAALDFGTTTGHKFVTFIANNAPGITAVRGTLPDTLIYQFASETKITGQVTMERTSANAVAQTTQWSTVTAAPWYMTAKGGMRWGSGFAPPDLYLDYVDGTGNMLISNGSGAGQGIQLVERGSDPAAPAANNVTIYARDNGSGKTQLVARFATGAVQVLATEP